MLDIYKKQKSCGQMDGWMDGWMIGWVGFKPG
jgi:hypothetical protein